MFGEGLVSCMCECKSVPVPPSMSKHICVCVNAHKDVCERVWGQECTTVTAQAFIDSAGARQLQMPELEQASVQRTSTTKFTARLHPEQTSSESVGCSPTSPQYHDAV